MFDASLVVRFAMFKLPEARQGVSDTFQEALINSDWGTAWPGMNSSHFNGFSTPDSSSTPL